MSSHNGTPGTVRDAARDFLRRGLYSVPLLPRSKKIVREGWEQWRIGEADIDAMFATDANIGLLLGEPSGGLVDVDLDCPEAVRAAPALLPDTGMISGRQSAPTSHWWYSVESPPAKASDKFHDPTAADRRAGLLLELRSTGGQSVAPPSTYPPEPENGLGAEACVWHRHGGPARVDLDDLRAAVMRVAAAALLGRHWPAGARHDAALALAGGLLRAGWGDDDVEPFVSAVCAAAGDIEVRDRLTACRTSAGRLRDGEKATGWPALAKLLGGRGEVLVGKVLEWLGVRPERKVTVGGGRKTPYTPMPAYVPFPTHCLPEPWASFVRQGAAALKCDEALVALPVLSVLAGAIGTSRRIHLGAEWFEPAVLWTCVVQESGGRKSPAAELSVDLVQARQKRQVKEFKQDQKEYKRLLQEYKEIADSENPGEPPAKPILKRSIVGDITIEKLSGILDDNRRGVLLYRDELSGWVGSFTRYKVSGGGSDESNWLSVHRAGPITYDRKTGEKTTVYVPFGAASVTGGIQPGTLARLMTAGFFESGLVARILFCMPPRTPKTWTDAGIEPAVKDRANKSLDALYALAPGVDDDGDPCPVVVTLSLAAKARMKEFVNAWGLRQFEAEGAEAAALAKLEALPGRFALVHHCVTKAASLEDTDPVAVESLEAGITLAAWFAREADRVYRMLGESGEEKSVRQLVELVTRLADRNGGRVTPKQLQNSNSRKYRSAEAAKADLERLVGHGLGKWVDGEASPKGGHRPVYFEFFRGTGGEGEPAGRGPARPHDPSDSRPDTDDGPKPEPHDPRAGSPDDAHPPHGRDEGATPSPEGRSADSPPAPEEQGSEESCGRAEAETETPTPEPVPTAESTVVRPPFRLVTTEDGLTAVFSAIGLDGGMVGLDTETTGLHHAGDRVRLLQLATARETFVIDLFAFPAPAAALAGVLEALGDVVVVGHNLGFDLPFLMRLGFVPGAVADTMLASQVLHAGDVTQRHGLKDVAARVLGLEMNKESQKARWSGTLTPDMLAYAARDAEVPVRLWKKLKVEAAAAKLGEVLDLEMAALTAVAWASVTGVGFDRPAWETLAATARADRDRLRERLDALAPDATSLIGARNWNSPEQVKAAFHDLGIPVEGTDDDTLSGIDHPVAAALREYRSTARMATTYGTEWLKHVCPDGRVYAHWKQLGAGASGRMSCKEPNLQQLPRDPRYRRCFVAPPGRVLVKADYSQIELRIAAKLTGERRMLAAYRDGEDLHGLTARSLLGKAEVTKADRQLAKAVNFGLLYGMGAKSLAVYAGSNYGVSLDEAQAAAHRAAFFKTYPGLRAWHRSVKNGPVETRTLGGRRRCGVTAFTEKLNTPVQGTGADGMKRGLARLWERRSECTSAVPVLFVHDEVVFECDEAEATTVAAWLKACMVDGMAPLIAPVPVEVEVSIGRTWGG